MVIITWFSFPYQSNWNRLIAVIDHFIAYLEIEWIIQYNCFHLFKMYDNLHRSPSNASVIPKWLFYCLQVDCDNAGNCECFDCNQIIICTNWISSMLACTQYAFQFTSSSCHRSNPMNNLDFYGNIDHCRVYRHVDYYSVDAIWPKWILLLIVREMRENKKKNRFVPIVSILLIEVGVDVSTAGTYTTATMLLAWRTTISSTSLAAPVTVLDECFFFVRTIHIRPEQKPTQTSN